MNPPVQVVFIASDSRSGSTLLDLALGQTPGFFSGGELRYIWRRGFELNVRCGCEAAFHDCALWRRVVEHLKSKDEGFDPQAILALQEIVDAPDLFLRTASFSPARFTSAYRRSRVEYLHHTAALYRAIREVTRCDYIIDSSKSPSHGFLLCSAPGVQVHVIHLVRDPRAVVWSLGRQKKRLPTTEQRYMPPYPPVRGTIRNVITNQVQHRLAHTGASYTFLRYEDFVRQPRATLEHLLERVGAGRRNLDFMDGDTMHTGVNHTVSGNPHRVGAGPVRIALDDEWRREMPLGQRRLITCLASPMLWRYGYLRDKTG